MTRMAGVIIIGTTHYSLLLVGYNFKLCKIQIPFQIQVHRLGSCMHIILIRILAITISNVVN